MDQRVTRRLHDARKAIDQARIGRRYQLPGGHQRVYLHHIRKTGGTSVTNAFLALEGEDPNAVKWRIEGRARMTRSGGLVFAGHDRRAVEHGRYFYGWTHQPAWRVQLPPGTFTVTVLRDPVARVVSLYRYLADPAADEGHPFPAKPHEFTMAADGFDRFLDRLPREHLLNQLHMFSAAHDPEEAAARIRDCSLVFFIDDMAAGLAKLSRQIDRPLQPRHERKSVARFEPTDAQLERLRDMVAPGYALMDRLRPSLMAS